MQRDDGHAPDDEDESRSAGGGTQGRKRDDAPERGKEGTDAAKEGGKRSDAEDKNGEDEDKGGDDKKDEPENPSFFRRHPLWILLGLVALAAAAVAGYFVWLITFYPYESTDDAFVDARSFAVATKVSGFLTDVPVTDNQHVAAGGVIAQIDPTDYQVALDQARARVEGANAAILSADAQIKSAKTAVEQAREQLKAAQAALEYARDENARREALVESGAGTVQAAQQAQTSLQQAQANAAQAQASVNNAITDIDVTEAQEANAQATLRQAQAAQEVAEQNIRYTTIQAAQPGRVVRLTGSKGQYVETGQSVAMFVPDTIWVTANFKESQITDMRPGQPVDLRIDAYPDHPLRGKVDSVQPGSGTAFSLLPAENATGNYVKVTQRVPVKIVVDNWPQDVAIGPGMSVVPTVTVRPEQHGFWI